MLKNIGVRFSLDDFGSGLASFEYLKTLPIDFLKIDGMFVRDIVSDPIDHAMVKSIHEVSSVMGKTTVAEFVESEDILNEVRKIGIHYVQGYHVGKPVPIEQVLGQDERLKVKG
jgi:EAL domain-containing protein (putative c-di-GMP-specific phosphodiesterase class I)